MQVVENYEASTRFLHCNGFMFLSHVNYTGTFEDTCNKTDK